MEKIKPALSKGTRDFLPEEVAKRNFLFEAITKVFSKYGFQQIETPAIERLETLTGKYGDEGDKLLFKILNSGDFLKNVPSEILAEVKSSAALKHIAEKGLRYDLTVPLARYVVQHQDKLAFPFRRFHIGQVWRADRPQKGRYQEFYQCDADIIGSAGLLNEVELILIFTEAFAKLGLHEVELKISNRKILAALAEKMNCAAEFSVLAVAIDKLDKVEKEKVFETLLQEGFSQQQIDVLATYLNLNGTNESILQQLKQFFIGISIGELGIEELETVINTALSVAPNAPIKIDLSLARGLDYYTGFIIEAKNNSGSLRSSIGSGGRYDNLTEIFGGKNLTGVGISFGVERIFDIMEELNLFPENLKSGTQVLFCHFDEVTQNFAFKELQKLRSGNVSAEIYPTVSKLGKQLDYANKKQIQFAVIVGSEEVETQMLTVKNLKEGTQEKVSANVLLQYFKNKYN